MCVRHMHVHVHMHMHMHMLTRPPSSFAVASEKARST